MSTKLAYLKSVLDGVLLPDLVNLINQFVPDIIIDDVSYIQKDVSGSMLQCAHSIHFYSTFQIRNDMYFRKIEKMTGTPTIIATSFKRMFHDATSFKGDISSWDVSSVKNMHGMFSGATNFNCDLSGWDVSSVVNMASMFQNASAFNYDLSRWNTSSAVNMSWMFQGAHKFDCDLGRWDTSSVMDMRGMFFGAMAFNCNLNRWVISSATNTSYMFQFAKSFTNCN